ncbi:type VII secretion protein EssA [Fictibacillus barbaricus]|uniref:Type VII secretion protein EssA n=1 Tax=Fictibacillus barbaricus TaxID=182136 RepID=A0ABS2Z861_9BACL|nr:type VII secretion protein EssA [Fictibacillus barbaricus]MBN3544304.1 type VII secretion protein EssA [Fictibacillus barbaricus]GGB67928.1 ESX secretion system protein YueC [Fictibacillus barbaricus]
MKHSKFLTSLLFLAVAFIWGTDAQASKNIEELNPNLYEEKERKDQSNLILDESLSKNKREIPEEQKGLSFNQKSSDQLEDVQNGLFDTTDSAQNNSILSKAKKMNLFSKSEEHAFTALPQEEEDESSMSNISLVYSVLIGLGILLIVAIMFQGAKPKFKRK